MKWIKKYMPDDKYTVILLTILAFFIYTLKIDDIQYMYLTADEFGLFSISAYLNGLDWSGITSQIGYYSFGFPLLFITPLYKIFENFSSIYRATAIINCILASLIIPVTYFIEVEWGMRRIKEQPINFLLVLIPAMSGCVIAYATLGLGEVLLILLAFCITYLIIRVNKGKAKWFYFPILSFLSIYMFFVHQRSIGIVLSVLIVMIMMLTTKIITKKDFVLYIVISLIVWFIGLLFKNYLQNNLWNGSLNANDFSGILPKVLLIFSNKDVFLSFCRTFIGQLFYIGIASFGLLYYAFYLIFTELILSLKRNTRVDFSLLFILLAFLSTFLISTLFMAQPQRADHFLYGRYNDIVYLLLLLYSLISVKNNKLFSKVIILIFWIILGLTTYYFYVRYYDAMSFMKFNVINLSLFYQVKSNWGFIIMYFIIIMVYILTLIYKGKYYLLVQAIGIIVMLIFSYKSAGDFTYDRINWSNEIGGAVKAISGKMDESENIYFSSFTNDIVFLQTEFPEKNFFKFQNEQSGYLIVSNADLFTPQIINLKKEYIGTAETALFFSLNTDKSFDLLNIQESQFDSSNFISDLSHGFLIYGPYCTLDTGKYNLKVELELIETSSNDIGYIDISAENATQTIFRKELNMLDFVNKKEIFQIPFSLEKQTDSMEFRVYINEGVKIKAKAITLTTEGDHK